jgi:formiminotetrahydrofolate cyclodeaminase
MAIADQKIKQFLNDLASKKPVPGGGAMTALSGALAAALVAMVANLTIGREKYKQVEEDFKRALGQAEKLKDQLLRLADEDSLAYQAVVKTRSQEAIKTAAEVPLRTAQKSLEVLRLASYAAEEGNRNAVADARGAVELATAAIYGAIENVRTNLGYIQDREFANKLKGKIKEILTGEGDLVKP